MNTEADYIRQGERPRSSAKNKFYKNKFNKQHNEPYLVFGSINRL